MENELLLHGYNLYNNIEFGEWTSDKDGKSYHNGIMFDINWNNKKESDLIMTNLLLTEFIEKLKKNIKSIELKANQDYLKKMNDIHKYYINNKKEQQDENIKREEDLVKREEDVVRREEDVVRREEDVVRREEDLRRREEDLRRREEDVVRREEDLRRREEDIKKMNNEKNRIDIKNIIDDEESTLDKLSELREIKSRSDILVQNINYKMKLLNKRNQVDCMICMGKISEHSLIYETNCGHIAHSHCFKDWYNQNRKCHICQRIL